MTKDNITITIRTVTPFRPLRTLYTTSAVVGVIGIGALLESAAMQWAGFVFLMLLGVSLAVSASQKDTAISIADARKLLDKIENKV